MGATDVLVNQGPGIRKLGPYREVTDEMWSAINQSRKDWLERAADKFLDSTDEFSGILLAVALTYAADQDQMDDFVSGIAWATSMTEQHPGINNFNEAYSRWRTMSLLGDPEPVMSPAAATAADLFFFYSNNTLRLESPTPGVAHE